jgi:uncharacterized membrane protein YraQ (UPF0718 family)
MEENKREGYIGMHLLGLAVLLYLTLYLLTPEKTLKAANVSINILMQIIPLFPLIIIFMWIVNYFTDPKAISKYVGRSSGRRGWMIAVFAGILSHGPTYLWYPLLGDLKKQGMKEGLIAAFLYARAIKIPLLPLMAYYFGVAFVVILTIYMILASVIEGEIIEIIGR